MSLSKRLDPALLEAAKSGDSSALDQVLRLSQPDLKRFARRSCSTAEDAEDAVQVALWRLQRKIGTLKVIQAFSSWLFRIVERECHRLFRARHPQMMAENSEPDDLPAASVPLDLRRDLSRAITTLPPLYREVLIMRDLEEMTAPEVAEQLQISIDAVKIRLHRARAQLRQKLIESGYWSGEGLA